MKYKHKYLGEICEAFMIHFGEDYPEWFNKAVESKQISVSITSTLDDYVPYIKWSITDTDEEIYTGYSGDYVLKYSDGSIGIVGVEIFKNMYEKLGE